MVYYDFLTATGFVSSFLSLLGFVFPTVFKTVSVPVYRVICSWKWWSSGSGSSCLISTRAFFPSILMSPWVNPVMWNQASIFSFGSVRILCTLTWYVISLLDNG